MNRREQPQTQPAAAPGLIPATPATLDLRLRVFAAVEEAIVANRSAVDRVCQGFRAGGLGDLGDMAFLGLGVIIAAAFRRSAPPDLLRWMEGLDSCDRQAIFEAALQALQQRMQNAGHVCPWAKQRPDTKPPNPS